MNEIATSDKRNALAEFTLTPTKVAKMAQEYMALTVPEGDTAAYKVARAALTILVKARTGTEKRRLELGLEAREWLDKCRDAAADLLKPLIPVEARLKAELHNEDARKEEIKAAKAKIEHERVDGTQKKIANIISFGVHLSWELTTETLNELLRNLETIEIGPDEYMEFTNDANLAKHDARVEILKAIETRDKFEAEVTAQVKENERLIKEREELAKGKAEQEAKEKKLSEEQATIDAEKKRLKHEEFQRKAKEDAKDQAEKKRLAQEKFEEEAKEKAKVQAEKDAKEKLERETKAVAERAKAEAEEAARQEALKSDKEKLSSWFSLFVDALNSDLYEVEHFKDDEAKAVFNTIFVQMERAIINGLKRIEEL